jgi:prepilin-type N-terminal cleavage/methylation domain-containing protein
MMPTLIGKSDRRGFTLIEVIVTIIAAAIVGVIFINFMGTAMSKSVRSVEMVQGEADAEALIEQIVADYVFELNRNPSTVLNTIKGYIDTPTLKYGAKVTCYFITFDTNGNEAQYTGNDENLKRTLKVTVAAAGNDLVTLLTRSRTNISPPVAF